MKTCALSFDADEETDVLEVLWTIISLLEEDHERLHIHNLTAHVRVVSIETER